MSRIIVGSAAQDAGIRAGDVIVKLNDTAVEDSADLRNAVGLLRPGADAAVQFYRDGELQTVHTKIGQPGDFALGGGGGVTSRLSGARFRTADDGSGMLITEVERGSSAAPLWIDGRRCHRANKPPTSHQRR